MNREDEHSWIMQLFYTYTALSPKVIPAYIKKIHQVYDYESTIPFLFILCGYIAARVYDFTTKTTRPIIEKYVSKWLGPLEKVAEKAKTKKKEN